MISGTKMSLKTVSTQQKYGLIKKVGVPKKSITGKIDLKIVRTIK